MKQTRYWMVLGLFALSFTANGTEIRAPQGKEPCRAEAYRAAQTLAHLRMPGETFQMGGKTLLNRDARAASALYEFDVLDQDPRHPDVWPGHTIIRVKMDTQSCVPDSIQFVETFMER